jgi:hypothetical protein
MPPSNVLAEGWYVVCLPLVCAIRFEFFGGQTGDTLGVDGSFVANF